MASGAEAEGLPIEPFWRVVEASPCPQVHVDEQNEWAEADPMSSFEAVGQVERCKKAEDPLGYVMVAFEAGWETAGEVA